MERNMYFSCIKCSIKVSVIVSISEAKRACPCFFLLPPLLLLLLLLKYSREVSRAQSVTDGRSFELSEGCVSANNVNAQVRGRVHFLAVFFENTCCGVVMKTGISISMRRKDEGRTCRLSKKGGTEECMYENSNITPNLLLQESTGANKKKREEKKSTRVNKKRVPSKTGVFIARKQ